STRAASSTTASSPNSACTEDTPMLQHVNFANVLTVAQAEKRLTRRLKRYWIFVLAGLAAATAIFVQYNLLHAFFSSFSATMGSINPRYLLSVPGLVMQGVFTLGVIFIA